MTTQEREERKAGIRALCRYYQEDHYGNLIPWIDAMRIALTVVRDEEREERNA